MDKILKEFGLKNVRFRGKGENGGNQGNGEGKKRFEGGSVIRNDTEGERCVKYDRGERQDHYVVSGTGEGC